MKTIQITGGGSRLTHQKPPNHSNDHVGSKQWSGKPGFAETILVRKDVYLRDSNNQGTDLNLLSNSLAAKLRKSLPADMVWNDKMVRKLRADNMNNVLNLKKQNSMYTNELKLQTQKLDKERTKILKRQELLKKYSKWSGRNREQTNTFMSSRSHEKQETRSGNNEAVRHTSPRQHQVSTLPLLSPTSNVRHGIDTPESAICVGKQKKKPRKTEPFRIADDADDLIVVRKQSGLFMPQTRYTSKEMRQRSAKIVSDMYNRDGINFETIQGPFDEDGAVKEQRESAKKRVTWSCPDQLVRASDVDAQSEGRVSTSHSVHSQRSSFSDSYMYRRPAFRTARSKIELIGVKWNISKNAPSPSKGLNQRSKDLHPVATGLEKESTSVSRTKWQVKDASTFDPQKDWATKIHNVKHHNVVEQEPELVARSVSVVTQCNSDMIGKVEQFKTPR